MRIASRICSIRSTWTGSSSGMGGRLALYSAKTSVRNVGALQSMATTIMSGFCFSISPSRAVVKMYVALVGSPEGLESCCFIGAK